MDTLFIWGIILAPMTALRIWKFGPGEILLILWMLSEMYNRYLKNGQVSLEINAISRYQLTNIIMMFVGMLVSALLYKNIESLNEIATEFLSHIFMLYLSVGIMIYFSKRELDDINAIISRIVLLGAAIYSILLIYGLYFGTSIMGFNLWMGRQERFRALAQNPHQIGMITGAGMFFSLYLASCQKSYSKKIVYYVAALAWLWISLSTKSDTMILCYVLCFVLAVFLKVSKIEKNPEIRRNNYIALIVICVLLGVLFSRKLLERFNEFVYQAGNGAERFALWSNGLSQFKDKPLGFFTGLGPGGHTGMYMTLTGNEIESHNTYVQLITNSGVFVCIYYVLTVYGLVKNPLTKNTYLVLSVMYFVLYGFGGNMSRRVLVWFTYTMVYILSEKEENTELADK